MKIFFVILFILLGVFHQGWADNNITPHTYNLRDASDYVLNWFKSPSEQQQQPQPHITSDSLNPKAGFISFATTAKKVMPAVVDISALQVRENRMVNPFMNDPFFEYFFRSFGGMPNAPRKSISQSSGSGVIISPEGIIATCAHVIQGATQIKIRLNDGQEFEADVLDVDTDEDLALLKVKSKNSVYLPYINIGNPDAMAVGDVVLAVGNAFGLGQQVTSGIMSAPLRAINGQVVMQTDASVNPGNSGGALTNLSGELVGIPNAILSRTGASHGVGFARPATLLKVMMDKLSGKAKDPWLGMETQTLTAELIQGMELDPNVIKRGVIVTDIHPKSPANSAGLKVKDILISFNDIPLVSDTEFEYRRQITPLGQDIKLKTWREGKQFDVTMKAVAEPDGSAPERYKITGRSPLNGVCLLYTSDAADDM
jgi:S1-C subfamily serine protease